MLSQEITLQRNPNSASAAAILKQVLSGQAAKRDASSPSKQQTIEKSSFALIQGILRVSAKK